MGMGLEMMMEELIDALIWEDYMCDNVEDGIWVTKDGEEIYITDMTSEHIRNCMKMLERNLEKYPSDDMEKIARCYLDQFQEELARRYPPVDPAFTEW